MGEPVGRIGEIQGARTEERSLAPELDASDVGGRAFEEATRKALEHAPLPDVEEKQKRDEPKPVDNIAAQERARLAQVAAPPIAPPATVQTAQQPEQVGPPVAHQTAEQAERARREIQERAERAKRETDERAERSRLETAERAERSRLETEERAERSRQETAERAEQVRRETDERAVRPPPVQPPAAEQPVTPPVTPPPVTPPAAEQPVAPPPVTPPAAEQPVTPPPTPPAPPATTEEAERAVTRAVDELHAAEHNLELADVATRAELARARADALARLDRALQRPVDELHTAEQHLELADRATRAELAQARAAAAARLDQALQPYLDRVIAPLLSPAGPPADTLAALNTPLSRAAPEVQQRVLADPRVQALVQRGADWANQPLAQGPRVGPEAQVPGRQAAERLNQLTAQLDPRLGVAVVNAAAPAWESFNQNYRQNVGRSMLGPQGMRELMAVSDRIYAAEGGQQAVARFAQMGHFDRDAVQNALAEGIGPAYALEYVRANAADLNVAGALEAITAGIQGYANGPVADLGRQYARHHEGLAWLIQNHGPSMTPDQLQAAIHHHIQSMGPEWLAESRRLEQALAAGGARLLNQFHQVDAFAGSMSADPRLASHRAALLARTAEIAGTPAAMVATLAAQRAPGATDPVQGAAGLRTLDMLERLATASNTTRGANAIRRLLQEGMTFYMKDVIGRYVSTPVGTPELNQRALDELRHVLQDSRFARYLGVSDKHYRLAVRALNENILAHGPGTPAEIEARFRQFDRTLDEIGDMDQGVKSFSRFTAPGQWVRALGLTLSLPTLAFSTTRAFSDQTPINIGRALVDGIGLTQRGFDMAYGLNGEANKNTALGRFLETVGGTQATRWMGRTTGVADALVAYQYFSRGDTGAGIFSSLTAGGGLLWSVGRAAWTGPVGFGLMAAGTFGLEVHRGRQEAAKYETPTSAAFLRHSGLSPEAASALVVQSGSGHSPVPMLFEYGRLRGLSDAQTVAWLDSLTPRQLESLRNAVHLRLDQVNGDVSTFTAGTPEDRQYVNQMLELGRRRSPYQLLPENAVRMDGLLEALGIPQPRP